jgi:dTDP-4-dehydrorhamnose reductase
VRRAFRERRPRFVLHCAAWTDVDGCEKDPAKAFLVNGTGSANVAIAAQECGAGVVAVSTDFVFDGAQSRPYGVHDPVRPISVYGQSKLAGEVAMLAEPRSRVWVLRTSWVYGPGGKNFPLAILKRARSGQPMSVVEDEVGSPSMTRDLAAAMLDLCAREAPPGIYHASNEGIVSRWQFATDILRVAGLADVPVAKVQARSLTRPAARPAYSALDCSRLTAVRAKPLPHYLDALQRYLKEEPQ